MISEHHFHLEILAPQGLAGIERYLPMSPIPLAPYFSNFTHQVILKLADSANDADFAMDGSRDASLHGSGHITATLEDAVRQLDGLSRALRAADFPHVIDIDDDESGRTATIAYRCVRTISWT